MKKYFLITISIAIFIITGCQNSEVSDISNKMTLNQAIEQATTTKEEGKVLAADLENISAEVPILIYHHIRNATDKDSQSNLQFIVAPKIFENQMKYLSENNFTSISFKNLADYFEGKFTLPKKPIIISFDDGLINQYKNALPVLKKYNLTATFFIFTNPLGRSQNYIDWDQLKELDNLGMEIGSHGFYHLFLNKITETELEKEVVESKKLIEENIGHEIYAFAYPFGVYNEKVTQKIKDSGYTTSRDIINGTTHTKKDLFELKGYFITENFSRFKSIIK